MRMWSWDFLLDPPMGEKAPVPDLDIKSLVDNPPEELYDMGVYRVRDLLRRYGDYDEEDHYEDQARLEEAFRDARRPWSPLSQWVELGRALLEIESQRLEGPRRAEQDAWLEDFVQWRQALGALDEAAPGAITSEVIGAADTLLASCADGFPDRQPLALTVDRWKTLGNMPPPGVLGVCAIHHQLVRPALPECVVTDVGALLIKHDGQVLAAFAPGGWSGFKITDD